MGTLRAIWRRTGIGRIVDTVRNIDKEGNFWRGIKRTVKEDITEDNPIGKAIYDTGKYDGQKEGYIRASNEYEKKLLDQAEAFLKQKKDYKKERDEYEVLLDDYERVIEQLKNNHNRTGEEEKFLRQFLLTKRKLVKLAKGNW